MSTQCPGAPGGTNPALLIGSKYATPPRGLATPTLGTPVLHGGSVKSWVALQPHMKDKKKDMVL
ncbi:hypothetical protein NQZ68_019184 [Dissostichus eleginoides]|nr:hypothetical protein NQZ68_019184 [Dissostichus eleginoides]